MKRLYGWVEDEFMNQKLYEKVRDILVQRFAIAPNLISPEVDIQKDLHLDSMDAIDLLLALNESFSTRIPEKSLEHIHTLSELVDAIEGHKVSV